MTKSPNPWKILSSEEKYENPWIRVTEYQVINPGGGKGIYGKVHFKNRAVGVVPVDGEGNTWARVGADDRLLPVRFDVFDATGAWLGRVTLAANLPRFGAVRWTADAVYAVMEDEDGVPAIHRYRIERGSGE